MWAADSRIPYHVLLAVTVVAGTCFTFTPSSRADDVIRWPLDHVSEVSEAVNFAPGRMADGMLVGETAWDPHFSLRVAPEGIDATQFTWLTVRLYSSAQADVLDIYYQSPDGNWCLGGKLPIEQGWRTYRLDLTKNSWRETRSSDEARQWGGPGKRVSALRIDPGNQQDRWIAIDYVLLQKAQGELVEGVTREPRGTGRVTTLQVPAAVKAGDGLRVNGEILAELDSQLTSCTLLTRLRRGNTSLRLSQQKVDLTSGRGAWSVEFPVSAYWYPGPATVEVDCYELDLAEQNASTQRECTISTERVGRVAPPIVELRPQGGDAAIFVNGEPFPADAFVSAGEFHPEYHQEIAHAGIHLYCDWFGTSHYSDMGHVSKDRYDYAHYDRYFADVLDIDPEAYFLPHIGITGPQWWQTEHPEEMCQYEDGTRGPTSFASTLWRKEMGEDLRRLIAYLRRSPYADRIIGYAFYNGYTAEWQMWGTWQTSRDDYSEPALREFRQFLQSRYTTQAALQSAWNDGQVTFETAQMPDAQRRRPGGPEVFRDPKTERQAVDFYEFISHMDADALLHFAKIVREATEGRALVGTYYAYLTAHGINQQDSGHLCARRVFDSPDIDFLMSPPNYWYRRPGEACTFMSATDSLRLRGKLWWDESDHRTHLTEPSAGYGRADSLHETLGVYWRELAEVVTKRAAVSWFDMSGGWFSDPQILSAMCEGHQVIGDCLTQRRAFTPEIGVFVDPQSFYWMRPTDANTSLSLHQVTTMPQSGAPWDFLLLEDIGLSWVPDYKLYVFLNAFHVSSQQRAAIQAKLRRNHATALFVYAPGYVGEEGHSIDAMRLLTGIRLARLEQPGRTLVRLNPSDPLAQGLTAGTAVGNENLTVAPLFYADDPATRVIGTLVENGQPGLVVKSMEGWTSVYSAAIQLPPALMRNLARLAGVHVWLETDDALYVDGQIAGLHASNDGEKILHFPVPMNVLDAVTGSPLATQSRTVTVPMVRAQTTILRLQPSDGSRQ